MLVNDRQRVLDATDIVRLIGEHVTLRAKGREYVGLCPFHDDHSPSMNVVPAKQIYHCFSCGAGGNAFDFAMNYHKMGFREAIEYLAEKFNVQLTPWSPRRAGETDSFLSSPSDAPHTDEPAVSRRSVLLTSNLMTRDFFRAVLNHPEHGKAARELVARREISPDMLKAFEIGAAPDRWDGLLQTAQKHGLDMQALLSLGLLKARNTGDDDAAPAAPSARAGMYDAFRNRLIFPIHDQIGRVIGFGGRRLRDKNPDGSEMKDAKYLNSAESVVFNKSTTLYGLYQAAQEIRRTRLAIVTEGYMDTIACHQAGVRNAVAALGTALTPQNAKILRRLCETVVLLFDGDEAGQRATDRAMEAFFAEPVDVKIAVISSLHGAKDPDELLKQPGGVDRFNDLIAGAQDALDYRFSRLRERLVGLGMSAQTRVVEEEMNRLVDLGLHTVEPMRQKLIIKRVANLMRVDEETVARSVQRRRAPLTRRPFTPDADQAAAEAPAVSPATPAEQLLACVLCDGSLVMALQPEERGLLAPDRFRDGPARRIAEAVAAVNLEGGVPELRSVLLRMADSSASRTATLWQRETERLTGEQTELLHAHWRDRLDAARRLEHQRRLDAELAAASAPVSEDDWSHQLDAQTHASDLLQRIREGRKGDTMEDRTRVPRWTGG